MTVRPRKPCMRPGCPNRCEAGHEVCEPCRTRAARDSDRRRGTSTQRGYGARHRFKFRRGVLKRDRICVVCRRAPATTADHYPRSRRELVRLKLNPENPKYGRGLCAPCHSTETATTDGQRGGWNTQR